MLSAFEIYQFEGLFIDQEMIDSLNIGSCSNIELLAMMQDYSNVYSISNNKINVVEKQKIQADIMNSGNSFCYISKDSALYLLKVKVFYGIRSMKEIVALYEDKNVRDIKLKNANISGISSICYDISNSQSLVGEINKQKSLRKVYDTLKINK